jgi:uracil-DNA glycosylase
MGLAFSVSKDVKKIPASLRNIYTEMVSDIGSAPTNGDLSFLSDQGVMLLNRGLTLDLKSKKVEPLWYQFTEEVAQVLGKLSAVGIFWGNQAQELAKYVHPSPLSAYKGFFGSKPFSAVNEILSSENKRTINWTKQ